MITEDLSKQDTSAEQISLSRSVPAAITDAGCERELNEDRYGIIESPSGVAWLVCDGMGGTAGGELAAQLALDAIRRNLESGGAHEPDEAIRAALLEANRIIMLRRQNPAFSQMGTTVVAAMFAPPAMVVAHAGDSRAYLVRSGAIQQLTVDHTLVQELVNRGELSLDEALVHPDAHILTRCLGSEPGLSIDLQRFWIWESGLSEPQDALVLCSDGLYSQVSDAEIARAVSHRTPQEACAELVELAKARGGYDNISLSVIPIGGQLREEPPVGYAPPKKKMRADKPAAPRKERGRSAAFRVSDVAIMVVLAVLAVALSAFMVFAFYLSE